MKPPLVIDKSFAQGATQSRLQTLSTTFSFWVPSAFYYEVFDNDSKKRKSALKGIGRFQRFDLATVLLKEKQTGKPIPIGEIDTPFLEVNPDTLTSDWQMTPEQSDAFQQYKRRVVEPWMTFWKKFLDRRGNIGFSESELTAIRGTDEDFSVLCATLCEEKRIKRIADELAFPHVSLLNESWLYYRFSQTLTFQALVLSRRYQNDIDKRNFERIEHDVQDIEYLTIGLHVGSLATAETSKKFSNASMGWRFRLLAPDGRLITPE